MEDLNYLLRREQEELIFAFKAGSTESRAAHSALACAYAQRIREDLHPYRTPQADGHAPFDPAPFGTSALVAVVRD